MREYQFNFLDQRSQIQSTKIAHCADDLAALEFAQQLKAPADIEIWLGTRLVTRLNAKGDSVPKERGPTVRDGRSAAEQGRSPKR